MRYVLVLLLAGIAFAAYAQSSSKSSDVGRFTVVSANPGISAWKLDTATGEMWFCTNQLRCAALQ
jgi:hypothetical protein